jgi:hypothetical protein
MNCVNAAALLNRWIDGELPPADAAALEAHLPDCAECRAAAEALRAQDSELRRTLLPQRQAAQQIAAQVLATWEREAHASPPPVPATNFGWGAMLLAVAAGFLLAVALFPPWHQQPAALPREILQVPQPEPPVARLVVATGAVEMRAPQASDWQAVSDLNTFHCPSGSEVRTGEDVRCELQTSDGCVIRLNCDTEISLASPTSVAIRRGQIWCSSPDNVSLQVVAPHGAAQDDTASHRPLASPWSFTCPSSACVLTAEQPGGQMRVLTSAGETELQTLQARQRLKAGECASIIGGEIVCAPEAADPLLAAAWVNTLLARKGSDDGELAQRINEMLSQVGRNSAYEQEIRGLGEHAAPGLLRFVQASGAPERKRTAMRLLSDLAPSALVPELIELLASKDAEIRVLAATALQRLTGQNQDRPAEQWRENVEEGAAALEQWRQWWQRNRDKYAPLPLRSADASPSEPPSV